MHPEALEYIRDLKLVPHPEGGYFRELYRSDEIIKGECLPGRYNNNEHAFATSIYFLLEGEQVSRFHRLRSDELWYFHAGSRASIYILDESGTLIQKNIGKQTGNGDQLQVVMKRKSWFSAEVEDKSSYILAGCMVSPGFNFADFELAGKEQLLKKFPHHRELILKFT